MVIVTWCGGGGVCVCGGAQDRPVTAVADAVLRARAGLGPGNRPVGSFLLLGPTGVPRPARNLRARALFESIRVLSESMSEWYSSSAGHSPYARA